jgi:hypothetical protein
LLKKAGLILSKLAADRHGFYQGKPIDQLPNLTETEKALILAKLDEQISRQEASLARPAPVDLLEASEVSPHDTPVPTVNLDLTLALQEEVLDELAQTKELIALVLKRLEGMAYPDPGMTQSQLNGQELQPASPATSSCQG